MEIIRKAASALRRLEEPTRPTIYSAKIGYRVDEAVIVSGLSRATLYEQMTLGALKSRKVAGRRLILREDLEAFLRGQAQSETA